MTERYADQILLGPPRTVGQIRVAGITPDTRDHGYDIAILNLKTEPTDKWSKYIFHVPPGSIAGGDVVEVLIRQIEVIPFLTDSAKFFNLQAQWLSAIRPFDIKIYGKPIDRIDDELRKMFDANKNNYDIAPAFYDRFLREQAVKPPRYMMP